MKNPFRKTPMQQLETTIASLTKLGEQLAAKRVTAQDALDEAIKTRQQARQRRTWRASTTRGYEGLCWGVGHTEAFAEGRGDASDVREVLRPVMPQAGEDRRPVADVFGNVYAKCIEFLAGRAAERMLLDGEPGVPADDLRQARELAMLICRSEEAIETFISPAMLPRGICCCLTAMS
jgi:hypothetical protein